MTNSNSKEYWKDIPGYENLYIVSSKGKVKSLEKTINRKISGKITFKEKILSPGESKGYYTLSLHKNKKSKTFLVHQLVAMAFLNHKPCGYEKIVDHINNIKTDNRVENLQIINPRKNSSKDQINKSSQYTGVTWDKKSKRWKAQIQINGKSKHLGNFTDEKEASKYYKNAVKSIEDGSKIVVKKPKFASKYKGVTLNKKTKTWIARRKQKYIGTFKTEHQAFKAYLKFIIENEKKPNFKK